MRSPLVCLSLQSETHNAIIYEGHFHFSLAAQLKENNTIAFPLQCHHDHANERNPPCTPFTSWMGVNEVECDSRAYLFAGALGNVLRDGVDLIMHLHAPSFPPSNAHQEHPEVCAAQIQCQEVSTLCRAHTIDSETVTAFSLSLTHTHSHTRAHTHTHSLTHSLTHARTHTHTHSHTRTHTHTHTHAHTHAHTHTHTHTHLSGLMDRSGFGSVIDLDLTPVRVLHTIQFILFYYIGQYSIFRSVTSLLLILHLTCAWVTSVHWQEASKSETTMKTYLSFGMICRSLRTLIDSSEKSGVGKRFLKKVCYVFIG